MSSTESISRRCLALVLAAGEGTRMKSSLPKVLHPVAGRTMLGHVLATVQAAGAGEIAVVIGPDRADVAKEATRIVSAAQVFEQRERLGTAHAVLAARSALESGADDVVVAFGDTPLVTAATFARLRAALADGAAVVALGFEAADPTGYGRLITDHHGNLVAIREHKDASQAERGVKLCNAGLMALSGAHVLTILAAIGNDNANREFYLTDAVEVAHKLGLLSVALTAPEAEVQGVNDRVQLAQAEAVMQSRLREAAMRDGVTMIAPETVFLSHDTVIGRDVIIEPHVVFGPGVRVESGAVIHAFSHLEGAKVGGGASVGPYARLRPGADLAEKSRVGNFVEVKNATLGVGAKVNHLTYIGDASIGAGANVGAGTITCNYDGYNKHHTYIGVGAFIGSNSALVAPVTIGDGAIVAAGSTVTRNVPANALALGRARQEIKDGWAGRFRAMFAKKT
jgi:bifunctional UDP-N-acetylglucosamine pyrophosphorylase / glucosamine-1-phosphate N-acetyltransferase